MKVSELRFERLTRVYTTDDERGVGVMAWRLGTTGSYVVTQAYYVKRRVGGEWVCGSFELGVYGLRGAAVLRACAEVGCPKAQARLALEAM